MTSSSEIQFVGPSWGHHGPYTFFRSFSYRPPPPSSDDQSTSSSSIIRSFAVGQFFFVRILSHLPICVAELQLLWESRRSVGTKLASVKLYFTPDSTPSGRLAHHGLDELLVADEKVVLEVVDLVKWVVDGPVTWPYGFQMPRPHHHQPKQEEGEEDVAMVTEEKRMEASASSHSSSSSRNGFKKNNDDGDDAIGRRRHVDPSVVIVTYSQYCRCRALAKRLDGSSNGGASSNDWMRSVVVMAMMSGLTVARDNSKDDDDDDADVNDDTRMMFCRETFSHPQLMYHDFRKDRLAPKLKGRKRRRKFSRLDSMESVDSDAGQVAMTTEEDGEQQQQQQQQRMKATVKRFKGLSSMPSSGIELISAGKETFEQHLYKFMRDRKTPIKRIPSLGFKEVDLFQFFIYSQKFGGYDKVTEGRHWKQIYDQMGGHPGNTSAATCTRRIYEKLLLTFERHVRCEEDKPLPISYMRPARKKLRELASMRSRHASTTPTPHDQPTETESVPSPIVDDPCVAMVTADNKLLETTEVVVPVDVVKMEAVAAVSVKVEVTTGGGQSLLTDGLGKGIPLLAASPPPPPLQSKLKVKLKRANSPPAVVEFKSQILKDQTIKTGSNGDLPLAPPTVQEPTSLPKLNPSLVSLSRACVASSTNRIMQTGSTLSINQPPIKGDSLLKSPHPLPTFPIQFFPNNPFVTSIAGVLERPPSLNSTATTPGVVGVLVTTTTTAPSNPLSNPTTDQKSKDQVALAPFGFFPPRFLLGSPAPGTTRNPLVRPTYGPPNVVAPFTPTSNGLLVPIFDARPPFLCHPIPNDLQKSLTRRGDPDKPSPAKSDPGGSARPSPSPSATTPIVSSSSGAWFNSPIKQFLDRTRALTSESRSNEADDQPIDLSVRATQKSSHEFTRGADVCTRAEQDEPLNLSRKHDPRAAKPTNLVLPSTKKLGGSTQSGLKLGGSSQSGLKLGGSSQSGLKLGGSSQSGMKLGGSSQSGMKLGGSSQSGLGRVVLPKSSSSDLNIMPLILSVPSPVNILAQSTAAAFSNVQSLSVAQGVVTNSASQGKKVPANNGLLSTPTVLSSQPFPTSLVGTAIGPVFQFFPSHPLASNIAYTSDGGRPVLLRFPMPVPPPPSPHTQAAPLPLLPPPSLLAAKGNKTN